MQEAKFKQVAKVIKNRVDNGTYGTKQKLPSEYDLADEFEVSRLTIRKAVAALINAQILVKSRQKGTYVMEHPKIESGRLGLQGFTEVSKAYGKKSHTEVLEFKQLINPDKRILAKLEMNEGLSVPIYKLVRRRYWDSEPMTVEQIYIPEPLVFGLTPKDFEGSLFAIIEAHEQIAYSQQEIEALLAPRKMADLLQVSTQEPLMKVESVTYTAETKPIFFDTSFYRADKYRFKTTLVRHKL